jgi:hypothetical protein
VRWKTERYQDTPNMKLNEKTAERDGERRETGKEERPWTEDDSRQEIESEIATP